MDTGSTERALNGQGWNNLSNKVNSNSSYNPKFKKKQNPWAVTDLTTAGLSKLADIMSAAL